MTLASGALQASLLSTEAGVHRRRCDVVVGGDGATRAGRHLAEPWPDSERLSQPQPPSAFAAVPCTDPLLRQTPMEAPPQAAYATPAPQLRGTKCRRRWAPPTPPHSFIRTSWEFLQSVANIHTKLHKRPAPGAHALGALPCWGGVPQVPQRGGPDEGRKAKDREVDFKLRNDVAPWWPRPGTLAQQKSTRSAQRPPSRPAHQPG